MTFGQVGWKRVGGIHHANCFTNSFQSGKIIAERISKECRKELTDSTIPSSSTSALLIESAQQIRQLGIGQFDTVLVALELRELKRAGLQPLVENAEPVTIPKQDLDAIATPVEEQKQVTRQGILIEDRFRLAHQMIEAVVHLRGRRAEENPHVGEVRHDFGAFQGRKAPAARMTSTNTA